MFFNYLLLLMNVINSVTPVPSASSDSGMILVTILLIISSAIPGYFNKTKILNSIIYGIILVNLTLFMFTLTIPTVNGFIIYVLEGVAGGILGYSLWNCQKLIINKYK